MFDIISYEIIDKTLPLNLHNISDHYLGDWNRFYANSNLFQKFTLIPFAGYEARLYLYYNPTNQTVIFHSGETTRKSIVGPQLYFEKPILEYNCDNKIRTLDLLNMGYPKRYKPEVFLTPIEYQVDKCNHFQPLKLMAKEASLIRWLKTDGVITIKEFSSAFN